MVFKKSIGFLGIGALLFLVGQGCRSQEQIDDVLGVAGSSAQINVVDLVRQQVGVEIEWSIRPLTSVTAIWFGSNGTLPASISEPGQIEVPALVSGLPHLLVQFPDSPARVYFDWDYSFAYIVNQVYQDVSGVGVEPANAGFIQGKVADFTPSAIGTYSEVMVYSANVSGAQLSQKGRQLTKNKAISGVFTTFDNNIELYLPPGQNELFFIERIVDEDRPEVFELGRGHYEEQFVQAGNRITGITFNLDIFPDKKTCGSFGEMSLRWPGLNRTFIRRKTGGLNMDLSIQFASGIQVPYVGGKYYNDRIRDGNEINFVYPLQLDREIGAAEYVFRSHATQITAHGVDIVQFKEQRFSSLVCDMVGQVPEPLDYWEYPLGGVSLSTEAESNWRWNVAGDEIKHLDQKIKIWPGPATGTATFANYANENSLAVEQPILEIHIGDKEIGFFDLTSIPNWKSYLQTGLYTLQIQTTENDQWYSHWHQDPVIFVREQQQSLPELIERQESIIKLLEFDIIE